MLTKLQQTRTGDRPRYIKTVKDLILQSMIKLLEPSLKIVCRQEDEGEIKKALKDLEKKYTTYMKEQTERDEYVCTLEIMSD